jgi:chemotaxis regulatin CheY-phosphate phosphatase CheZ
MSIAFQKNRATSRLENCAVFVAKSLSEYTRKFPKVIPKDDMFGCTNCWYINHSQDLSVLFTTFHIVSVFPKQFVDLFMTASADSPKEKRQQTRMASLLRGPINSSHKDSQNIVMSVASKASPLKH